MPDQDWFSQNTPAPTAPAAQQDWFGQNTPGKPLSLTDWGNRLGEGVAGQVKGMGQSILGIIPRKGPDGKWDVPTAHAILNLTTGLVGKAAGHPLAPEADAAATAFINQYKDRYGSWDGFKSALANDPASVLGDAVTLATGASGLAEGGALAAEKAGASGAASALRTASPIRQGANAAINVGRGVGNALGKAGDLIDQAIDVSGKGRAATLQSGLENAAETQQWHPSFQLAEQALGGQGNGKMANDLYKALPLIKAQEGTPRDLSPFVTNPSVGPVGKVPMAKKLGPIAYMKDPQDFLQTLDHVEAQTNAKNTIWQQYEREYLGPHRQAGTKVSSQPILDAVNNAPSIYAQRANPGALNAADERAARIYTQQVTVPGPGGRPIIQRVPRQMSTDDLQAALRGINAERDAFSKQAPGVQQAALDTNPIMIGLDAEAKAVRDLLYTTLGNGDDTIPRDMMQHYGALTRVQDGTLAQLDNSLGHDPGGLRQAAPYMARAAAQAKMGELRGAASNLSTGMVRGLVPSQGPGLKLTKSLQKLDMPPAQWAPPKNPPHPPAGGLGQGPLPSATPQLPAGAPPGPPPPPPPTWSIQAPPLLPAGEQGGAVASYPKYPAAPEPPLPNTDYSVPTSKSQLSKFKQTGGNYVIQSRGKAELGSYDKLAEAQKAVNDSSFVNGAVKIVHRDSMKLFDDPTDLTHAVEGPYGVEHAELPPAPGQIINATPVGPPPDELPPAPPPAAKGITVGMPAPPTAPKPPKGPALPKAPKAEALKQKVFNNFRGQKQRLDRQFVGMAKKNKIGAYGVPPGVLTDAQQGQYNTAVQTLQKQQDAELASIPPDLPPLGPVAQSPQETVPNAVGAIPAAGGANVQGPTQVVVGEPGPERIDHSDGRPSEVVNGTQLATLGTSGADKVTPLTKFPPHGIIRGSANIPLSEEGKQHAVQLGQQLAQAGGLDLIRSSDLARTRETAQALAQATGAQLAPPTPGLRSWALGDLEGQPSTPETDALVEHHINAAPDEPLPGQGPVSVQPGESFNQFKQRVLPVIQQVQQEWAADPRKRIALVTHNRDEKLIRGWLHAGGGADVDKRVFNDPGGEPGSIARMVPIGQKWRVEPFDPATHATGPGIYLVRHCDTDWNPTSKGGAASS